MFISGLQKLTLLDYPGRLATTVFLSGCNFRCPFCHNASLVLGRNDVKIEEDELQAFLKSRVGKLQGVCITGGEPTLHRELPSLINNIKELGFLVKLDTNGTNPALLGELINNGLIDYCAMDIKSSKDTYHILSGVEGLDIKPIEESVSILLSGKIEYEFRTTVVKPYHKLEDFKKIGEWIRGARAYFLQGFRDSGDIISPTASGYDTKTLAEFLGAVTPYVPNAQIRG